MRLRAHERGTVAVTPEEHVAGHPVAVAALDRVRVLLRELGPVEEGASTSQVAFRRRRGFAWLWLPGRYLAHPSAEVVLSIALGRRDPSPRFKQVVQSSPAHVMHHLEVHDPADLDDEVAGWLREAFDRAG